MVRRVVVDFGAVRASRQRLDALAVAHPELLSDENRARLADALADLKGCDDDDEEAQTEEEAPHAVSEGQDPRTPTHGRRDDDSGDPHAG